MLVLDCCAHSIDASSPSFLIVTVEVTLEARGNVVASLQDNAWLLGRLRILVLNPSSFHIV